MAKQEVTPETSSYMMAFNDNEEALALLRDDESGLYVRADGQWFTVPMGSTEFDGVEVVEVEDDFLAFYDKLDAKRTEPSYKQVQAFAKPEPELEDEEVEDK